MYGELDGTFPNHPADPLQPANQRDLRARVVSGGFDLGLAFDGDADRVFVVDETGNGLSGSTTTAILAAAVLRTNPGATVLHNLICSRAVPETMREHGGIPVRTRSVTRTSRGDGRHRRGLRRRALGALLLRPQLPRRQRADRVVAA
jgi:phosphomannomutase